MSRVRDGQVTALTTDDGLYSDNIYQVVEDEQGRLRMGSGKGIFRLSRKALGDYAAGCTEQLTPVVFGENDGLRTDEMNGGTQPAGWRRANGSLWFPTAQGTARIDPDRVRRNVVPAHRSRIRHGRRRLYRAERYRRTRAGHQAADRPLCRAHIRCAG